MSDRSKDHSQISPKDDPIDRHVLSDLGNFQKTSFASFLHYTLDLVDAVPKSDTPPTIDEINGSLELCLAPIIAAMESKQNKALMQCIYEGLVSYCRGHSKDGQREGLLKAMNGALVLLQPLSIGNSRPALDPYSNDLPFFMCPMRRSERVPGIVCMARKHGVEVDQKENVTNPQKITEDLSSLSQNDRVLEWKHHHSCWEYVRGRKRLDITQLDMRYARTLMTKMKTKIKARTMRGAQPLNIAQLANYKDGYTGTLLREYGHIAKYDPPLEGEDSDVDDSQVDTHLLNAKHCAEDAAKVFYDTLGRDHILNVAINDNLLRVWYFDHESPIQTSAFNFIENLPYFFMFLFALQRFSPADWGYIDRLSQVNSQAIDVMDLSDEPHQKACSSAMFKGFSNSGLDYHVLSLCGRATHVIFGNLTTAGGKDTAAALKLSWRQKVRSPEGSFLREARQRFQKQDCLDACDYLPTLLGEEDFPRFSTEIIRKRLMIPVKEEETRQPYFIILPRYEPLIVRTIDWNDYFDHHIALIYCHFMLWTVGIEHGDISRSNLMWDPNTKKPKLCDFDLSHFSDQNRPPGFTNTGIWRFMASDLLSIPAMEGEVKRLYRHDLESFIIVLIWVMFCYDNGKFKNDPVNSVVRKWCSPTFGQCAAQRDKTFTLLEYDKPPSPRIPLQIWSAAGKCIDQCRFMTAYNRAMDMKMRVKGSLTAEEQKRLDHLNSTGVITEFLEFLTSQSIGSQLVHGVAQRIKDRIHQTASLC